MLERASTCLESGGRQLVRAPRPCLRSRRRLHSTFWHHSASDLSLPIWWAASSIFDGGSGDVDDRGARSMTSAASRPHDGALLDFLYPKKTLALLERLSVTAFDTTEARRRRVHGTHIRPYSTAPWQPARQDPGIASPEAQETKQEVEAMLKERPAVQQLPYFLHSAPPGKHEVAWQLYEAIPEAHFSNGQWKTRIDLLRYLNAGDKPASPTRILTLFEQIPAMHRRPSSYRAAVVAYISLRMVGKAIELLEKRALGINRGSPDVGIDILLKQTVVDRQWPLCFRVLKLFLRQSPVLRETPIAQLVQSGESLPELWKCAADLSGLPYHFQSLLHHVREYQHGLRTSDEWSDISSLFTMSFVPHVVDQLVDSPDTEDKIIDKSLRRLFEDLRALQLPTITFYDRAILRSLDLARYQAYADRDPLWLNDLYKKYRQTCLDFLESSGLEHSPKPSKKVLRKLLLRHSHHDMRQEVDKILEDLHTFYPKEFGHRLLRDLVHIYADRGDVSRVKQFLEDLKVHRKGHVDLFAIQSLPFAYARRADVDGAITAFNRISDEYGLVPDLACWNALLLAYVRADDLDGALNCFNDCLDSGITPDKYSFNTLLMLCADRGDVEGFEALFSRAKQMGVLMANDIRARSGYVQAFLNAGDPDGASAIARGMLQSWKNGTLRGGSLTHTWNMLIQHHALEQDILSARARYQEMVKNKIPLDSWTYGSLMRALTEVKQSNAAFKILRRTMPSLGLRVEALHYAIIMTGLLKENQPELALRVHEHMVEHNIEQTASSRAASICVLGAIELQKLKNRGAYHENYRLKQVEGVLKQALIEAAQGRDVHRQPGHSRLIGTRDNRALPQFYYGLMMSIYAKRRAYKIIKKLLREAEEAAPDSENYVFSMTLIEAAMAAHLRNHEHAEVARYWNLARDQADRLTKTARSAIQSEPSAPTPQSIIDAKVLESSARISNNRRHMLIRPSRVYIRSLLDPSHPNPNALQEAERTMRDLLTEGYRLDNFSWNEFVIALAQRGRLVDAFTVCEMYLIPEFPGWRDLDPTYERADQYGYKWMDLRHYARRKDTRLPRYKTLIVLASALRRVRNDERDGFGWDPEAREWLSELVQRAGPMTLRAIESMPRTNDRLQTEYFHARG